MGLKEWKYFYIIQTTYDQLSEYYQDQCMKLEDNGPVTLVSSMVRLIFTNICAVLSLIYILVPMCGFVIMFACFLLNNLCSVLQSKDYKKIMLFGLQTSILILLVYYGFKYLTYPMLNLIFTVMETCLRFFRV